ncbi:hypothetical protein BJ508DRAFT_173141 [Ascobolus immersus RN42]|uniref:Uncharacterized protein n=1 Tax=Ascobolus immersus RN42 TaxID=1160509 RepID=A0A3N4HTQ3_ASCIM|nr:hypothetical protein BJ508DRAFT_173141 [Ascobolus immersus RN42]
MVGAARALQTVIEDDERRRRVNASLSPESKFVTQSLKRLGALAWLSLFQTLPTQIRPFEPGHCSEAELGFTTDPSTPVGLLLEESGPGLPIYDTNLQPFLDVLRLWESLGTEGVTYEKTAPLGLLDEDSALSIPSLHGYLCSVDRLDKVDPGVLDSKTYLNMRMDCFMLDLHLESSNSAIQTSYRQFYAFWGTVEYALSRMCRVYALKDQGEWFMSDENSIVLLKHFASKVNSEIINPILKEADHYISTISRGKLIEAEQAGLIDKALGRVFNRLRLVMLDYVDNIRKLGPGDSSYFPEADDRMSSGHVLARLVVTDKCFIEEREHLTSLVVFKYKSIVADTMYLWCHVLGVSTYSAVRMERQMVDWYPRRLEILQTLKALDKAQVDKHNMRFGAPILTFAMVIDFISSIKFLADTDANLLISNSNTSRQRVAVLRLEKRKSAGGSEGGLSTLFESTATHPSVIEQSYNAIGTLFNILSISVRSVVQRVHYFNNPSPDLAVVRAVSHADATLEYPERFLREIQLILSDLVSEAYRSLNKRSKAGMIKKGQEDLIRLAVERLFRKMKYFLLLTIADFEPSWRCEPRYLANLRSEAIESRILHHLQAQQEGVLLLERIDVHKEYEVTRIADHRVRVIMIGEVQERWWEWRELSDFVGSLHSSHGREHHRCIDIQF